VGFWRKTVTAIGGFSDGGLDPMTGGDGTTGSGNGSKVQASLG
jgi:hypothetical protein